MEKKMIDIGRVCVKLAGRDAGMKAVIIDILDDRFVLIDGETRRKKCNILHLEPQAKVVQIEKNATHEQIAEAFKAELDIILPAKKAKAEKSAEAPVEEPKKPKAKRVVKKKEE
jgi:large subunit ribosomal protein L14e